MSINNIFRFQIILMVIFESKLISVDFKEKKNFFFKILNEISKKIFFSFENRKITTATHKSVVFKICSQRLRYMIVFPFLVQQFTPIRHLGEYFVHRKSRDDIHYI